MKRNQVSWPDDPVVEEVRRARRELWKQAGGTLEGLSRLVKRLAQGKSACRKRRGRAVRATRR